MVKPIPDGMHSLSCHLVVRDAAKAVEFWKAAFGATEVMAMPGPDGRIMHGEVRIGDSILMYSDEFPDMGGEKSIQAYGGSPGGLFFYTEKVDEVYARALAAGATPLMPPMDMFWGDRYCKVRDPFGMLWALATHIEDVPEAEMPARQAEFMKKMGG